MVMRITTKERLGGTLSDGDRDPQDDRVLEQRQPSVPSATARSWFASILPWSETAQVPSTIDPAPAVTSSGSCPTAIEAETVPSAGSIRDSDGCSPERDSEFTAQMLPKPEAMPTGSPPTSTLARSTSGGPDGVGETEPVGDADAPSSPAPPSEQAAHARTDGGERRRHPRAGSHGERAYAAARLGCDGKEPQPARRLQRWTPSHLGPSFVSCPDHG
jgi:hypothetical protein